MSVSSALRRVGVVSNTTAVGMCIVVGAVCAIGGALLRGDSPPSQLSPDSREKLGSADHAETAQLLEELREVRQALRSIEFADSRHGQAPDVAPSGVPEHPVKGNHATDRAEDQLSAVRTRALRSVEQQMEECSERMRQHSTQRDLEHLASASREWLALRDLKRRVSESQDLGFLQAVVSRD
jgi:Spy/CpxP family protein refolding chaperone